MSLIFETSNQEEEEEAWVGIRRFSMVFCLAAPCCLL
jgi:hypothetical protein